MNKRTNYLFIDHYSFMMNGKKGLEMKKMLLCGLLMFLFCIMHTGAYTAVNDTFTVPNIPVMVGPDNTVNVCTNDYIPLTGSVVITEQPKHGSAFVFGTQAVAYNAKSTYFGADSFKYKFCANQWCSNEATVSLTIVPYNGLDKCVSHTWLYTPANSRLSVGKTDYSGCKGIRLEFFDRPLEPGHGTFVQKTCDNYFDDMCFDYIPNTGFRGWDSFIIIPGIDSGTYGNVPGKPVTISVYVGNRPSPPPGFSNPPTDPDLDGIFEDLNGNSRLDFADVVLYFNQMTWIAANEPVAAFDLNGNGRIDFADVVALFNEI